MKQLSPTAAEPAKRLSVRNNLEVGGIDIVLCEHGPLLGAKISAYDCHDRNVSKKTG